MRAMSIKQTMQLLPVLVSLALLLVGAATARKTTTHVIKFYMHDVVTAVPSSPATAVRIARGVTPLLVPAIRFGDMFVFDDPLTEGPDRASPAVGTAQGFYIFASQTELALMQTFNIQFTAGPHNGSTIAVQARNAFLDPVRELPVVGGTGMFRGATGYGLLRSYSLDNTTLNGVLQVDMYVRARV